jgi:DNA-binding IclR family transcriptional regulator
MAAHKNEDRHRPKYSAPALEKGLDILELLAAASSPLSLSQIGQGLDRTSGEIFRMLAALERRGFLTRGQRPEQYLLTNRLFELAHRHPPAKRLLANALPIMEELARAVHQSCHLAVRHEAAALIVAQADCPGFTGFSVRVGAHTPLVESCSGRVLLAFQPPGTRNAWLARAPEQGGADAGNGEFDATLQGICDAGYNRQPSLLYQGIVDFGAPILDHEGLAMASLTIPCLAVIGSPVGESELVKRLTEAARTLTETLGVPKRRD